MSLIDFIKPDQGSVSSGFIMHVDMKWMASEITGLKYLSAQCDKMTAFLFTQ